MPSPSVSALISFINLTHVTSLHPILASEIDGLVTEMIEFVDYKENRYHLQSSGRFFSTRHKVLGERLLHRVIWTEHNGPIPEEHDIHHKDEDWRNSDIDNLEC